jgi:hypothetical protein
VCVSVRACVRVCVCKGVCVSVSACARVCVCAPAVYVRRWGINSHNIVRLGWYVHDMYNCTICNTDQYYLLFTAAMSSSSPAG